MVLFLFFRQREIAIQSTVHQLAQSERWNSLTPVEQQQVFKIEISLYFFNSCLQFYNTTWFYS